MQQMLYKTYVLTMLPRTYRKHPALAVTAFKQFLVEEGGPLVEGWS